MMLTDSARTCVTNSDTRQPAHDGAWPAPKQSSNYGHASHRRLDPVLALQPDPRAPTRVPISLRQRHHPCGRGSMTTSLQRSRNRLISITTETSKEAMNTYFIFETLARDGMLSVTEAPARSSGVVESGLRFGVTVVEWFFTTHKVSFVMKVTAQDDESVAAFVMAINKSGNVTSEFTRAYTPAEWTAMVSRLT